MEWTVWNIIFSVVFALCENALYILMRKREEKRIVSFCLVLSILLYVVALCFLLLSGSTMKQTMLVLIASLPGAFISIKGENGK